MITVEKLAKTYQGYPALDGLSLHVAAGEIYGFIGHNGAGKTTTMNILAGLSSADNNFRRSMKAVAVSVVDKRSAPTLMLPMLFSA